MKNDWWRRCIRLSLHGAWQEISETDNAFATARSSRTQRLRRNMQTTALVLALAFFAIASSVCQATLSEGVALLQVQQESGLSANWSTGQDPCSLPLWDGVNCSTDGHVTTLNLTMRGMKGPLPSALGLLPHLEMLHLSHNQITDSIPSWFANFTSLRNLTLAFNPINGPFPEVLLQLTNLTSLKVDNTQISGQLPSGIKNLQKLTQLYTGNNTNLKGPLPKELGQLSELTEITMWANDLNDVLPPELGNCTKLRYINFHDSAMIGGLPESYGSLPNLTKLLLHNNLFNGTIPSSWSNLMPYLVDLELNNNRLSGPLPDFIQHQAHGLTLIGCNYFSGTQPVNNQSLLYSLGNCFQQDTNSHRRNCQPTVDCITFYATLGQALPNETSKHTNTALIGAVLGSGAGVAVLIVSILGFRKWRETQLQIPDYFNERTSGSSKGRSSQDDWVVPKGIRRFTIQELAKATQGFDKVHHIGSGGFGQVYSGCLEEGTLVAIKRASKPSLQDQAEFRNELELLSRLHHRHLVRLEGFCDDANQQILVYDFMSNGNLRSHVKGRKPEKALNWYKRIDIALGVAQGLDYLHSFADPPVIHRDVKPSNILLDEHMVAKLSDFGISKVSNDLDTHVSTSPAGTAGFLDPEYFLRRQLTPASDVYSFGVVLLELITGQEAVDHKRSEDFNLVEWVKPRFLGGGIELIVDSRLQPEYPPDAYTTLTELAIQCTKYDRHERPTMKGVVSRLENLLNGLEKPASEYRASQKRFSTFFDPSSSTKSSRATTTSHTGDTFDLSDDGGRLTFSTELSCR